MSETILEIKELKKILRRQSHPPRTFSRYQKGRSCRHPRTIWLW